MANGGEKYDDDDYENNDAEVNDGQGGCFTAAATTTTDKTTVTLTHWPLRDMTDIIKVQLPNSCYELICRALSCEIIARWIPQNILDDKSTLVLVMAWCRQAPSHNQTQCWPRYMMSYSVTRPHWVAADGDGNNDDETMCKYYHGLLYFPAIICLLYRIQLEVICICNSKWWLYMWWSVCSLTVSY